MRAPWTPPDWLAALTALPADPDRLPADRVEAVREAFARWAQPSAAPEVSVLLVARNEERLLFRCLASLCRLPEGLDRSAELVFVDNGSVDGTAALARRCGLTVLDEPRPGIGFARARALAAARGRYVLSADADTCYPPDWGRGLVDALSGEPELACAYGHYHFLPDADHPRHWLALYRWLGEPVQSFRAVRREFVNVLGFNMAYRRLDALRVGGYPGEDELDRAGRGQSEDGRLALRLSVFGKLRPLDDPSSTVWTSPRGLDADGGVARALCRRAWREMRRAWPRRRTIVIE